MYYVHRPSGRRKERRQAALLIAISALFIVGGALMVASGETGPGWVAIIFFSACLLGGVAQWRGSGGRSSRGEGSGGVLLIIGSYLFGAACLGILASEVLTLGWTDSFRLSGTPLTVIAAIGTAFFGGGAVLMTVRAVRVRTGAR